MTKKRVLLINPNSNPDVTKGMSEAVQPLQLADGPELECGTSTDGPFGIETDEHIAQVIPQLVEHVQHSDADAFVIGCYSDPGIDECRLATDKPVFGLQQSAVLAALAQVQKFGVIALSEVSIARHLKYIEHMGVSSRLAGERPINLSVEEGEKPQAYGRLLEVGKEIVALDGAECLILGCAGLARHRAKLQSEIGAPIIDPVQAAAGQAMMALLAAS